MTGTARPPAATDDAVQCSRAIRALRATAAHVDRMVAHALDPHNLTPAQFIALQVLHDAAAESLGCSELGKRLSGPAPDITRLLDRLETAGLVSRDRDRNDRRMVHTHITHAGTKRLREATPSVTAAEERALADLGRAERMLFTDLLVSVKRKCPGATEK